MQFGLNIYFFGGILGSAAGESPLYKRAHWRGSMPDTHANERGPKISKVAKEN